MYTLIAILGSLLAVAGTVPYVIETIKGKAKPRVVSWFTWALLTGIAAAAAFSDGQLAAGFFALAGTLATGSVVVAGWRYGDRTFTRLDIVCQVSVLVGLVLWLIFNSPALAVWAAIIIDFVGFLPTYKHAWDKPKEETPIFFALVCAGGLLATLAALPVGGWTVTSVAYQLYVALSMASCLAILMLRTKTAQPAVETEPQG
jgi:hypothetical protein